MYCIYVFSQPQNKKNTSEEHFSPLTMIIQEPQKQYARHTWLFSKSLLLHYYIAVRTQISSINSIPPWKWLWMQPHFFLEIHYSWMTNGRNYINNQVWNLVKSNIPDDAFLSSFQCHQPAHDTQFLKKAIGRSFMMEENKANVLYSLSMENRRFGWYKWPGRGMCVYN